MNKRIIISLFYFLSVLHATMVLGKVRLPKLVSDGMVIQRDTKLKIWGWADEREKVVITFKGKKYTAITGVDRKWQVWLTPSPAGGPYTMDIHGSGDGIIIRNILVGDVWVCAGQSNMVHYLDLHKERYAKEIAAANYPEIRQFLIQTNPVLPGPADDIPDGSWKSATPKDVLRFSVVAYFFAKKLYDKYAIPIGLINASVGGSRIEAWTSEEGLKGFPDLLNTIQQNKDSNYVNGVNRTAYLRSQEIARRRQSDKGLAGITPWYDPSYLPKNWKAMNIPGYWEDQGIRDLDGIVWYRREMDIPVSMAGIPAQVALGRIVDADYLYINGEPVGNTTYQYPQRRYEVRAGLLVQGKNSLVIRVINQNGKGGFVPDKPYYLAAGRDTIDLKGTWYAKVGAVYDSVGVDVGGIILRNQPTAFYNGMVAPLTNYAVKGIIWYQGESNADRPEEYKRLLPALIADWRRQWGLGDVPFLYVQLPNFMDVNYVPAESNWALMRDAQSQALREVNTGMVVAIDLGEWNDIHPGNKRPVGERLALAALKLAYQEKNIVYSGPVYSNSVVNDNKVVLSFDHVGGGLISLDGEDLKWFAVAGSDKKFMWANAIIQHNKVIVWSEHLSHPMYVRYAWADNPDGVNFYNQDGLPASPFEVQVR
ncbi:MAG: sialate O-acetylesterase [Cyclobacteriaceae bacterium]|nr:sialate O-acetylesterase [Cyclobacteriaceae bacterium]MDH4298172.1 sialate O-acetylesterase [Cyclobacteriaceae bacterium]MDH5249211.1 sialate O-acetylesterase [Cyclobacteriaceae bacterium]